ncbi:MAG: hypothetical protein V5B32_10320 [Candidatus Accumulibacter sp. UW26]|jgi:hypothetical protein
MRIPAEVIPPLAGPIREPDVERRAEPVGSSARLADDVTASPQGQPPPFRAREARPQLAASPAPAPVDQDSDQAAPVDRRKTERRRENQSVLLDTRSSRGRRKTAGEVPLNIKV